MKALLIVDMQNDFMPGGALPVPKGDEIVPFINQLQKKYSLVIASQDWHPPGHISFIAQGGPWPVHCLQNSWGAELVSALDQSKMDRIFFKGSDIDLDSYSAFFDNARKRSTGLAAYLNEKRVKEISVVGVATDFCVKYSVLDALSLEFQVTVFQEGCRGIGDSKKALQQMQEAGALIE